MSVLNTEHKRKSAIITAVILMLLVVGVFNYGMKYLDPPIEYGLAINFGNSEVGSGEPVQNTKKQATQEQQDEVVEEEVKENSEETIEEEVITDDSAKNVPVIEKSKEQKKEVKETPKKTETKQKPKPSKQTTDALNSLLNGTSKDGATKGEGDDNETGVKGNENGNPNSNKYYGNSGSGSGGNYNLAGRKALSKPIKKPDCEEEGTVVVSIEVNQKGKVIKALVGGVKGSTSSAACLEKAAKEAALKTRWNADGEAPSKQRGTIIYKFSLSQ
ncbi:energy transducer TonB family protein [Tenacibaculum ovolyticum]|uniref:energy transducer TonB family protein n=1 Tax=Tenacibaculum ovolyticum TaxID=104270 RepID=UPI003BAB8D33